MRRIEIEKEIWSRAREIKARARKARISEYFDNRRYLRALNLTSERRSFRSIERPVIIDKSKVTLLALLERRSEINDELIQLYEQRNKDYLDAENKSNEISVRLRARRRAFNKLYDVDRKAGQYVFTAEEKAELYSRMNTLVEMAADVEVLKRQEKRVPKADRESYREAIATNKDKMAKIEDSLDALVEKAERRTYIDDKRHVWIWVVGIAAVAGILILLFSIFSGPIIEFITNWSQL